MRRRSAAPRADYTTAVLSGGRKGQRETSLRGDSQQREMKGKGDPGVPSAKAAAALSKHPWTAAALPCKSASDRSQVVLTS